LIGLFWAKYARRIFAIVSTTSIPDLAPLSPAEATADPPSRASRLDADHPENGVLIPCQFSLRRQRGDRVDRVDRHRYRSWSLDPSVRASHPRPRSISSSVPCLSFTLRQVDQARRPLHGRERPPGGHGPG
jgi:hypothetical protein